MPCCARLLICGVSENYEQARVFSRILAEANPCGVRLPSLTVSGSIKIRAIGSSFYAVVGREGFEPPTSSV